MTEHQQERASGRFLVIASAVLALLASVYLVLAPVYATQLQQLGSGPPTPPGDRATLLEVEGWKVVRLLLFPVFVSGVPLLVRTRREALAVRSLAALLLLGFAVLGLLSVGVFYVPSALAMGAAVLWIVGRHSRDRK